MAGGRQPTSLLLLKGNKHLSKNEIEERMAKEPKKAKSNKAAKPPEFLPSELHKEFKATAKELMEIDIFTNLDVDTLARYLISKKMYNDVTDALYNMSPNLIDEYGKLLNSQDKLFKQCRQTAMDLGMTITSRCKIVIPKKDEEKEKTKEEKMFGDAL